MRPISNCLGRVGFRVTVTAASMSGERRLPSVCSCVTERTGRSGGER